MLPISYVLARRHCAVTSDVHKSGHFSLHQHTLQLHARKFNEDEIVRHRRESESRNWMNKSKSQMFGIYAVAAEAHELSRKQDRETATPENLIT